MKLPPLPPGPHYAYLVIWSKVPGGPTVDAGIYSSEFVTMCPEAGLVHSALLLKVQGRDYADASHKAWAITRRDFPHLLAMPTMKASRKIALSVTGKEP